MSKRKFASELRTATARAKKTHAARRRAFLKAYPPPSASITDEIWAKIAQKLLAIAKDGENECFIYVSEFAFICIETDKRVTLGGMDIFIPAFNAWTRTVPSSEKNGLFIDIQKELAQRYMIVLGEPHAHLGPIAVEYVDGEQPKWRYSW